MDALVKYYTCRVFNGLKIFPSIFKELYMQAFRNVGGEVKTIQVDVDIDGNPILPPDTTVDPRPEPLEGHYVTVVDRAWVQIPIPVQVVTLDALRNDKLTRFDKWREKHINRPVDMNGVMFDADELSRSRVTQALTVYASIGFLPAAWMDMNKQPFPLTSVDDLKAVATAILAQFNASFFEAEVKRAAIVAATTEAELAAVDIPETDLMFGL